MFRHIAPSTSNDNVVGPVSATSGKGHYVVGMPSGIKLGITVLALVFLLLQNSQQVLGGASALGGSKQTTTLGQSNPASEQPPLPILGIPLSGPVSVGLGILGSGLSALFSGCLGIFPVQSFVSSLDGFMVFHSIPKSRLKNLISVVDVVIPFANRPTALTVRMPTIFSGAVPREQANILFSATLQACFQHPAIITGDFTYVHLGHKRG